MNMKRTILFSILVIFCQYTLYSETVNICSFNDFLNSLLNGEQIRVVVDYSRCLLESDGEISDQGPQAWGGMNVEVFEYFAPGLLGNEFGFVAFSHNSFIQLGQDFIYDYVKFRIFSNDSCEISVIYLNPGNLEILMEEKFITEINDSFNDCGLFLYIDD